MSRIRSQRWGRVAEVECASEGWAVDTAPITELNVKPHELLKLLSGLSTFGSLAKLEDALSLRTSQS